MSLVEKMIDSEEELIGKKIVEINLNYLHQFGYIIVEGGEFLCFQGNGQIEPIASVIVQQAFINFTELRELFFKYGCISKEEHDRYEKEFYERKKLIEKRTKEREYEHYLELKEKFSQEKISWRDVFDSMKVGVGSDYLKCIEHAIAAKYEYLAFNSKVYATTDRDMSNPVCIVEELI